jgi:hypothetical protein
MSLLGTPVYANPSTPLWLPATGAQHTGPFVVQGDIDAVGGSLTAQKTVPVPGVGIQIQDTAGNNLWRVTNSGGNNYIQSSAPLYIAQNGQVTGNIFIQTSAPGAGADIFSVFGQINAIGGDVFSRPDPGGNTPGVGVVDGAGDPLLMLTSAVGVTVMEIGAPLVFAEPNQVNGNSGLQITPAGTNGDVLTIGGTVDAKFLKLGNSGTDPVVGTGTLAAGTATINTTACDVTSYILLTHTNLNASTGVGTLRVVNKIANSFTVNSVDATGTIEAGDLSDFDWMIINPA